MPVSPKFPYIPVIISVFAICTFIGWVASGNEIHILLALLLAVLSGELFLYEDRETEKWMLIEVKCKDWIVICRMNCRPALDDTYDVIIDTETLETLTLLSALAPVRIVFFETKRWAI